MKTYLKWLLNTVGIGALIIISVLYIESHEATFSKPAYLASRIFYWTLTGTFVYLVFKGSNPPENPAT